MTSVSFNPQFVDMKEKGRIEQAKIAGLSLEDAAKFFKTATHKNFQKHFNLFVETFPKEAKIISDARPEGVGPGEMLAYFIFDNIHLGGKNSSCDLWANGKEFAEMKGGKFTKKTNTLDNFKISKDGDPAVGNFFRQLHEFNTTFERITGSPLPMWKDGSIGVTALTEWEWIDLQKLSKKFKGISRLPITVMLDPATMSVLDHNRNHLFSMNDASFAKKVVEFTLQEHEIPVDNNAATLDAIVKQWRATAYENYLKEKSVALIDIRNMKMHHFGEITEDMIGLYCVHRNQPWARIYLP